MTATTDLAGQTLLVIGGSSGIGLETARRARDAGAEVIITARNADSVHRAGLELGASIAAFDATDFHRLERFFHELPPIAHVMVAVGGARPAPVAELDVEAAREAVDTRLMLPLQVARLAAGRLRPGGMVLFTGCTVRSTPLEASLPAFTSALAREVAPVRVNLIMAGLGDAADVAALAVHLMTNTAVTGGSFEIDRSTPPAPVAAAR